MASTFYVSPQGLEEPFATIARARDAIREMKAKQPLSQPVTVLISGGPIVHYSDLYCELPE